MNRIISVALITLLAGCATSELLENWREPDTSVSIKSLNKVLVIAYMSSKFSRVLMEEKICIALNGKGIPSYEYFKENNESSEVLDRHLRKEEFDGAVVIRLIATEQRNKYIPGHYPSYYYDFQSYQHFAMQWYYQGRRFITGIKYCVEMNVYSFKTRKLIWSTFAENVDSATNSTHTKAILTEIGVSSGVCQLCVRNSDRK